MFLITIKIIVCLCVFMCVYVFNEFGIVNNKTLLLGIKGRLDTFGFVLTIVCVANCLLLFDRSKLRAANEYRCAFVRLLELLRCSEELKISVPRVKLI